MRFSIIVPVYNVEQYLAACVESIMNQTYDDFEVLLVDDGSTDGSGKICDAYAARYENVYAYHKPNGGLSDARNYGMDRARGEYLVFVDSDDWIAVNSLEKFSEALCDDPDVLVTRLVEVYGEELQYKDGAFEEYLKEPFSKQRALAWNLQHSANTWPAPKYIVKARFVREMNMRFLKGRLHEDVDWSGNLFYRAETYSGCAQAWYYHRMNRPNSITTVVNGKSIVDTIEIAASHCAEYHKDKSKVRKMVVRKMAKSALYKISRTKFCSNEDKQKVICCIKQNQGIFRHATGMKHRLFGFMLKILGVDTAIKMLERI